MPKITALPLAPGVAPLDVFPFVHVASGITDKITFDTLQSAVANAGTVQSLIGQSLTSALQGPILASAVSFTQAGAQTETVQANLQRVFYAASFPGYDESGNTSSVAAINAAIAASTGHTLIFTGTPLLDANITVLSACNFIFDGYYGVNNNVPPKSYFIKKATLSGPAITFQGGGARQSVRGGGVFGQNGNSGDNISVLSYAFSWEDGFSYAAGRHGIFVGDAASATNCDFVRLTRFHSFANLGSGIHVESNTAGAHEANAFRFADCVCDSNTINGMTIAAGDRGIVVGFGAAANLGFGLEIGSASFTVVIGGDIENNVSGQIKIDANASDTQLIGLEPAFTVTNNGVRTMVVAAGLSSSVFPGPLSVGGQLTVGLKLNLRGGASVPGFVMQDFSGATTQGYIVQGANTSGNFKYGLEGSAGGEVFSGTRPFSAVFGAAVAKNIEWATNNTSRWRMDSTTGALIPLSPTPAAYRSSDNSAGLTSNINVGAKILIVKDGIVTGFS